MKVVRTRVRSGALTRRLFASGLQQAWQIFDGAGGRLQRSDRRHRLRNHTAFGRGCLDRGRREAVWRSGGLAVWRSGGLAVWRSGRIDGVEGVARALCGRRRHDGPARRRLTPVHACERGQVFQLTQGRSCRIRLESLRIASKKAMRQPALSPCSPNQGVTTPRFRIRFPRTIGFQRDVRLIALRRCSNATSSFDPNRQTAGHAST
ncbi:hypothetical protein BLA6860_03730 [Burkholderia lata]|nr:hypothetical protein BLA6860_03730 [Burkholderia lata]